jgi:deoxyribonuclease V
METMPLVHSWDVTPREARALQEELRHLVKLKAPRKKPRIVVGLDVSVVNKHSRAAACAFNYKTLEPLDVAVADMPTPFPYVPGLLSFREIPVLVQAIERLAVDPDLILIDGHGIAHPRRIGVATHLGLLLDLPTIGCAKKRLTGRFDPPLNEAGSMSDLADEKTGELIGKIVRTRTGGKPMFISPGHRMDLETAVQHVLHLSRGYRLPEPTRRAHQAAAGRTLEAFQQEYVRLLERQAQITTLRRTASSLTSRKRRC